MPASAAAIGMHGVKDPEGGDVLGDIMHPEDRRAGRGGQRRRKDSGAEISGPQIAGPQAGRAQDRNAQGNEAEDCGQAGVGVEGQDRHRKAETGACAPWRSSLA